MLYNLFAPMWRVNDTLIKLLKEVLDFRDDEINQMISEHFMRNIVNNLTLEQAKEITEIFGDNGFDFYLNPGKYDEDIIGWNQLGISLLHNPPKAHYCDEPLVSRDHLCDLSIPQSYYFNRPTPPHWICRIICFHPCWE
ncbi:hypothetical protein AALB16_10775 [Lachnospiraceae bacterium 62-35]